MKKYKDEFKQKAFENAIFCLCNGYRYDDCNFYNLSYEESLEIWNEAEKELEKPFIIKPFEL